MPLPPRSLPPAAPASHPLAALLALLLTLAAAAPAPAQRYLETGHVDLDLSHAAVPGYGLSAHHRPAGAPADLSEPVDHVAFFVPDTGGRYAGLGGVLPFLGATGDDVWIIPQNAPSAALPWVGFAGYGLAGAPATTAQVRFLGVGGPAGADFALWQIGVTGTPRLFFSNRPGTAAPQTLVINAGQHAHFNWGFSRPGFYRVRLRLEHPTSPGLYPTSDYAVDFAVSVLPAYELWRRDGRFTAAERADRLVGGPAADPDADGRPNLLEYALGAEPRVADAPAAAPRVELLGGAPALRFRPRADPLLVYTVRHSADLARWSEAWSARGSAALAAEDAVVPAPATPAPGRFLRLDVTHGD
jgi:surface-anchored protein